MKKVIFAGLVSSACLFAAPSAALAEDESAGFAIETLEQEEEALMKQLRSLNNRSTSEPTARSVGSASPEENSAKILTATRNSDQAEGLQKVSMTEVVDSELAKPKKVEPVQKVKAVKQKSSSGSLQLSKLREAKYRLQSKLNSSESKLQSLVKELTEAREKLVLAEAEVARLSRIIEARNIRDLESLQPGDRAIEALEEKKYITPRQNRVTQRSKTTSSYAPAVVTVTARKANLRVGPGKQHSVLFHVNKNSRLVVETRQGEWYRVVAPSGERAWISASVVNFAASGESRPSATLRVKGYQ